MPSRIVSLPHFLVNIVLLRSISKESENKSGYESN